jgi:acetyl-CoA carboxylase biotin carboxyl carrier protein
MTMLVETIKKLVRILKEENIDEIEVRRFFTSVRVARRRAAEAAVSSDPRLEERDTARRDHPAEEPVPESAGARQPAEAVTGFDAVEEAEENLTTIVSPMVGTFYRASSPQSNPFVREGKHVEIGEVLCIIEAMKLMNEIEAETGGIIRKILVDDAQPVEYGQPLFLMESA